MKKSKLVQFLSILAAICLAYGMPVTFASVSISDLDPSFGVGGKVITSFDLATTGITDIALQPDGKILAVGATSVYSDSACISDFVVTRYNNDGSLDTSFGSNGQTRVSFSDMECERGQAVALQTDGKILVAGGIALSQFALARLNQDGSLDASFNNDGKVTLTANGSFGFQGVAVQADGKILAVGTIYTGTYSMLLVRYDPDGSLDPSFGDSGMVVTDFNGMEAVGTDIVLQADGKILVAGASRGDFALARFSSDGTLDITFGNGGLVIIDGGGYGAFEALAIDADGKIVAAGDQEPDPYQSFFFVARFNTNGEVDSSFASDGQLLFSITSDGINRLSDVGIQLGKRIVLVGSTGSPSNTDFALVRLKPDGSFDPDFSGDGRLTIDFGESNDEGRTVVVQPDLGIVAGGAAGSSFALARCYGLDNKAYLPLAQR